MRRGVPNTLMNVDNRVKKIDLSLLPTTEEAVESYTSNGGRISEPCVFGVDPLLSNDEFKEIRDNAFFSKFSFQTLFCEVVNGCEDSFCNALLFLIDITYRLSHS